MRGNSRRLWRAGTVLAGTVAAVTSTAVLASAVISPGRDQHRPGSGPDPLQREDLHDGRERHGGRGDRDPRRRRLPDRLHGTITRLALQNTRPIDLKGKRVLPGLIDGHIHGMREGYHCWDQGVRLDLTT